MFDDYSMLIFSGLLVILIQSMAIAIPILCGESIAILPALLNIRGIAILTAILLQ